MKKDIYLTTAIPYVNGSPHIGHAVDYLLADVYARYLRLNDYRVRFQVGTDEHGGKIAQKALDKGISTQKYVDENSAVFKDFIAKLEIEYTDFIRTTDEAHKKLCQEIWRKLSRYIYKASYKGWYCSGCERFITDKEFDETGGICPDHQRPYEQLEEENYYLRISDFRERILQAIETGEMRILPEFRKKEVLKLLEESPDVSISRPVSQLEWGIPVPDDDSQVMYVWMDALSNYITVLGYPEKDISRWWPASAQFMGKDVLRFHAIIWPAILLGLGLELPRTIVSHGMILSDGQKMSKSIGNVVNPVDVIQRHGVEAFRYYFLKHIDTFNDSDFTWKRFEEAYNNELANDLGNLVQRLATLACKNKISGLKQVSSELPKEYKRLMEDFQFSKGFDYAWGMIQGLNKKIDEEKPWSLAKAGELEKLTECMNGLIADLMTDSRMLMPFLPETVRKIEEIFVNERIMPPKTPLFPK